MNLSHLFNALIVIWATSEIWLGLRRRSGDHSRQRDGGTLRLLMVTIYLCVGLGVWLSYQQLLPISEPPRYALILTGMAMMIVGMLFRWWSIRVLAEYFTVDVSIRPDHRIVRDGPYRWLRHPSYTGALLSFLGLAAGLGNLLSAGVLLVPVIAAFVVRIRVEEQALAAAFPKTFPAYARQRRRLVPGLW